MKKTLTSLAVLALISLGTTATTTSAVADAVPESDVIVASADAVLTYIKPTVTTTAAPVVVVPVKKFVAKVPVKVAKPIVKAPAKKIVPPVKKVEVPVPTVVPPVEVQCYEDMPCWNCATMGNLICGPIEEPVITEPNHCVAPTLRAEDGSCVNPNFWK